ncbi:hypothetical protein [Saccharothrix obliqua]|uniref:hypothetical protein n=1 Tax=Saccharothrix obliqua TaxID=2861747 RepID=UPI001C5CD86D|nr:hypothetical protein [Saccharothrix obliqua]MBW4718627.1 hypothetical protein [Saccharothrix obliqua]
MRVTTRLAGMVFTMLLVVSAPAYATNSPADSSAGGDPRVKHLCYSAHKCAGKILSNRDKHNCKVKSKGKSWRFQAGAACEEL